MKIIDRLGAAEPCFSFEFFPPHTQQGVDSLFRTVVELAPLNPGYVSCTYPGSSTPTPEPEIARRRRLTIDLTRRIRDEAGVEAMAHLTCSAHSRDDLIQILDELADEGADNVLALRGDPPQGGGAFVQAEGGFEHGIELIKLIRERGYPFCVGAACYPEKHQESPHAQLDLLHLEAKVDAGADFLISHLFFDNGRWFNCMRPVRAAGIEVPVIPALMPITNREGIIRMTDLSGAYLPEAPPQQLDTRGPDPEPLVHPAIPPTPPP